MADVTAEETLGSIVERKVASRSVRSGGSCGFSGSAVIGSEDKGCCVSTGGCGGDGGRGCSWSCNLNDTGRGGFGNGLGMGKVPPASVFLVSNSQDLCSSLSL